MMASLFYENFKDARQWLGGNNKALSLIIQSDPLGQMGSVGSWQSLTDRPDTFSNVIYNSYKSYSITFDYLGLPKNNQVAVNLGCVLSISDGGSLTDSTVAYSGAVKNSIPPTCPSNLIGPSDWNDQCGRGPQFYQKHSSFIFLENNANWQHYSIAFTATSSSIRVALADFVYANYPESGLAGDCYFANLLVTDSYGPSPFIATANPENFRAISVDILNMDANSVSYTNSNAAVTINLASNISLGGFAAGDKLVNIVNIIGSNYGDKLLGNNFDNTLSGGDGDDQLTAGRGRDTLIGGEGADKFIITTEITTATVQDFQINADVIDLRLFPNFYSFSSIKEASIYSNGNTNVNLGSGKALILSNTNHNDLNENNFNLNTLAPTLTPTNMPSPSPSIVPTTAFPSFAPTTSIPTVQPTTSSPTTPSPTTEPSTSTPTVQPTTSSPTTSSPTIAPTTSPPTLSPTTAFPTYDPTARPTETPISSVNPTISPTHADSSTNNNIADFLETAKFAAIIVGPIIGFASLALGVYKLFKVKPVGTPKAYNFHCCVKYAPALMRK